MAGKMGSSLASLLPLSANGAHETTNGNGKRNGGGAITNDPVLDTLPAQLRKKLAPLAEAFSKSGKALSVKEVVALVRKHGITTIDFKFTDVPGTWQHFSVPSSEVSEGTFESGVGFDGSSIRGFKEIHESDMLLIPDPGSAVVDPVCAEPTLSLHCEVVDPVTRKPFVRDPRGIARRAEQHLRASGIADVGYFGPELEFFIFDEVRYGQSERSGFYTLDSSEGHWNAGREEHGGNLGYKIRAKEGYFPVPPADTLQDIRTEMMLTLIQSGITVEAQHHEVATAGQCEIDMRYNSLTKMADNVMLYKYILKNVARRYGKTVTFMPKPLYGDNGTGMHCHTSLWKAGKNLFYDKGGYAGISQMGMHFIGGILKHAPALVALTNPTTNSYRRLVPGYEAPVNLVYSQRNRSAAIRIPMYFGHPGAKRIEFRTPDPSSNPYLTFSAILMAGLDGIKHKMDPGKPLDTNIYELSKEDLAKIPSVPGSLGEALSNLEKDHKFLLEGGVFTPDFVETWIDYKRAKEVDPVRLRPVPYEFHLYFDC